jgi:hypothetical protein
MNQERNDLFYQYFEFTSDQQHIIQNLANDLRTMNDRVTRFMDLQLNTEYIRELRLANELLDRDRERANINANRPEIRVPQPSHISEDTEENDESDTENSLTPEPSRSPPPPPIDPPPSFMRNIPRPIQSSIANSDAENIISSPLTSSINTTNTRNTSNLTNTTIVETIERTITPEISSPINRNPSQLPPPIPNDALQRLNQMRYSRRVRTFGQQLINDDIRATVNPMYSRQVRTTTISTSPRSFDPSRGERTQQQSPLARYATRARRSRVFSFPSQSIETEDLREYNLTNLSPVRIRPSISQIRRSTELLNWVDISNNSYQDTCPIDMQPFVREDVIMRIRSCRHIFREMNLRRHFRNSPRCPICRYDIRDYITEDNVYEEEENDVSSLVSGSLLDIVERAVDRYNLDQ